MKIPVKLYNGQKLPIITKEGDWFDIAVQGPIELKGPIAHTAKRSRANGDDVSIRSVEFFPYALSLNMAMLLPEGFEAVVLPRSSTFNKFWIKLTNGEGVIDNAFRGNGDVWGARLLPFKDITIPDGTRLFQFRIQLSQKATFKQKLKWLFWDGKVEFVEAESLGDKSRGGYGEGTKYLDSGNH